jgi:hypothetical protein
MPVHALAVPLIIFLRGRSVSHLTGSVGVDGKNLGPDVLLTQRLLNGALYLLIPLAALPENGVMSPVLGERIRMFQERVMRTTKPDGRIDPNGASWRRLVQVSRYHHRPLHVQAFLDMAAAAAKRVQAKWRVPASVLLGQAAVESGWGRHVKGNAYFGIKGKSATTGSVSFRTTEVLDGKKTNITDTFRSYTNFEEAADDYGRFLNENTRYQSAFGCTNNPLRFIEEVAKSGYATDPNYAATVKSVIESFHLAEYDR